MLIFASSLHHSSSSNWDFIPYAHVRLRSIFEPGVTRILEDLEVGLPELFDNCVCREGFH